MVMQIHIKHIPMMTDVDRICCLRLSEDRESKGLVLLSMLDFGLCFAASSLMFSILGIVFMQQELEFAFSTFYEAMISIGWTL